MSTFSQDFSSEPSLKVSNSQNSDLKVSESVDLGSKYKGESEFKFLVKRKKSKNEH